MTGAAAEGAEAQALKLFPMTVWAEPPTVLIWPLGIPDRASLVAPEYAKILSR